MSGINLKNNKSYLESLRIFEEDRKIDQDFVIDVMKEAIAKAYQKDIDAPEAEVEVSFEKGELHVYHLLTVVEDNFADFDDTLDITISDAKHLKKDVQIGEKVKNEIDFNSIGRTSINVAKQMLKQRIKENEKQKVYDEYKDKEFELVNGIIKTVEEKFVLIDIKNTIGVMLKSDQIPGERYRENQAIRTIIKKVDKNSKGSQVQLSRADAMFVKRLFEKEVPEIAQGIVEIKAIAREAGVRTKMAVYSKNDDVDAIGSCIGPRGSRIQGVITEIRNEKIDVFEWNEDIGELVKNALAPAEVNACFYSNSLIDPDLTDEAIERHMARNSMPLVVVVDDDKLSVAIGKQGKNAKLAVKLTNRKIDIKTASEIAELGIDVQYEVTRFKQDQARIIKEKEMKKFQELQEEAMKRKAEFDEELANVEDNDLIEIDEDVIDTVKPVESYADVEASKDEDKEVETVEETVKSEPVKPAKATKKTITLKTDYKSKFEEMASAPKKEETVVKKKKKKVDDDERRVRSEDLDKKEYGDIKPEYSDEELEEIEDLERAEDENSWINDDEIDFDEYDEYYDEEK